MIIIHSTFSLLYFVSHHLLPDLPYTFYPFPTYWHISGSIPSTHHSHISLIVWILILFSCSTIDKSLVTSGPWLMSSSIHVAFYTQGHGFFIIGYLGLVSLHFYYCIALAYVTSCVLKPPWGHEIRCRLRQPLLGQVFEIWLIFRYHHASSSGRYLSDVWTNSVVDMDDWDCTFDDGWFDVVWFFWSTIHLMPYWGIFPFQLRFIDLHGVAW